MLTIKVNGYVENGYLVLSIEDNGSGYPENMLQEGSQAKTKISISSGSTGLGLYFASIVANSSSFT